MPSKTEPDLSEVDPALFVRVKDKDTGHEYDVRAGKVQPDLQTVVKDDLYPPSERPRAPKHNVTKAGRPVTKES